MFLSQLIQNHCALWFEVLNVRWLAKQLTRQPSRWTNFQRANTREWKPQKEISSCSDDCFMQYLHEHHYRAHKYTHIFSQGSSNNKKYFCNETGLSCLQISVFNCLLGYVYCKLVSELSNLSAANNFFWLLLIIKFLQMYIVACLLQI